MSTTVGISELKLGMFVHLDLGWWAHPFARSSFMITSADQIATIRGLGLSQVRWSPEKSRLDGLEGEGLLEGEGPAALPERAPQPWAVAPEDGTPPARWPRPAAADTAGPAAAETAGPAAVAADAGRQRRPGTRWVGPAPGQGSAGQAAGQVPLAQSPERTGAPLAAAPTHPAAQGPGALPPEALRREQLEAERAMERQCQARLAEARAGCQAMQQRLADEPQAAAELAASISRAMVEQLLASPDASIRTLPDAGGPADVAHALNVSVVALLVGQACGLPESGLQSLGLGALLHDIGKLALPERLRHTDGLLSAEDALHYRSHVALGVEQGQRMGLAPEVLQVIAQHHELADGSGFPQGERLEAIAQAARIVALVDRYDKLCNPAQPAQGLTPHEALALLFAQSRSRFDGAVLNAFIRLMGVYPPGSVVQLTDGRYATVVKVNAARPLKPRVLVCEPSIPPEEALLLDLDTEPALGIRRSLKPPQLPTVVRDYLSPQPRMVYFFESALQPQTRRTEAVAA